MSGYPVQIDSLPPSNDFHFIVDPRLAGSSVGSLVINGVGTATLIPYFVRLTVNPGDDVEGATRLMSGFPDTQLIGPDSQIEITSASAITSLYWIGIGNTSVGPGTAAPANYTGNAYIVTDTEADLADYLAQQCVMMFQSTDNVRKVRITTSPIYGANFMSVKVEGLSYE